MRNPRRRFLPPGLARVPRLATLAAVAAGLVLSLVVSAFAREATVRGGEMNNFGRIALRFDQPTKVSARVSNGILVISFPQPVTVRGERLVSELPSYVSMVRRDPDGTGLRVALTKVFRPNILEAGERIFVDLLPENWTGLPPGLPQDVVTELAQRAREAESKVVEDARQRRAEPPKPLTVRVARLPTLVRAVFAPPRVVPISFKATGSEVELQFEAALTLEAGKVKAQLGPAVRSVSAQPGSGSLLVRMTLEEGYEAHGFREDESFVVDLAKAKPPAPPAEAAKASGDEAAPLETDKSRALTALLPVPAAPPSSSSGQQAAAPAPPVGPAGPVRPLVTPSRDGLKVAFPFAGRTAAAAFERGGLVTLFFHTDQPVEPIALPADVQHRVSRADVTREGPLAIVRLTMPEPQLLGFAAEDGAWVLRLGDPGPVASEPLTITRKIDEYGHGGIAVDLAEASGVHWTWAPESGERLAVATAFAPTRGAPKPQSFVDFRLLQTIQGVAIAAVADDLKIAADAERVSVRRPSGLAVSTPSLFADGEPGARKTGQLVLNRDEWRREQSGHVLDRYRQLLQAAADAAPAEASEARLLLSRFLMANGLNAEAAGMLDYAAKQDPALLRQPSALLLRGIAAARLDRLTDARKFLSTDIVLDDPEAILWRAVLDAREKRWQPALVGFRRSNLLLDVYPDEVQGSIRLLAAGAAIEMQDYNFAENEMIAVGQLPAEAFSAHAAALVRGRLEESAGKLEAAGELYRKLGADAERPVGAEAAQRWLSLALRTGALTRDQVIAQLETLSFIWRGDDIEIATIAQLGRLYAEAGRWREAFTMAARANRLFPDHHISRALHDETGRLFDDLFLSGKGDSLSRVDALALYFDFKQFTPIGRRGDEIVRRLTDRLVELDLLEQASELLQHQIEHRLSGAARATVAARLATIRLLDNKPALALGALQTTRLPELPAAIKRARMLLEARALSDLSRTELALEVLSEETGPEIERLRADIHWTGRRWREAGEIYEQLVGTRWQTPEPLSDRDRVDVLRAAVAFTLGDEKLSLDRLRMKFAAKMADSADARTFAFLTRPNIANTKGFRDIARTVTSADTLADFLAEYRKRYPEAATPDRRPQADAAAPETAVKPQAQRADDAKPTPRT